MQEDHQIWKKFKSGDKSALSWIYFQNFDSMFQYGMKFKEDSEYIKDCIQDVFFQLIEAGERLGTTDNIRFYLLKAMKNALYKKIERDRKIEFVKELPLKFETSFSMEKEFIEKEVASEKENALAKALNALSERQREIIYLRYECDMGYDQISSIMQLKGDSARKLVFRAVKTLKSIIDKELKSSILFFIRLSNKYVF